jgi:primosomal protein N' (replication factor Y) (superfamily II helicase)
MTSAPLRLKVQKVVRGSAEKASVLPVAHVWVDTGVPHLDFTYDYLVPDLLTSQVSAGVKVVVNFAGRTVDGYVLSRTDSSEIGNLKFIEQVLSPIPLLTSDLTSLVAAIAQRWGSSPLDILSSAIPARVIAVEKNLQPKPSQSQWKNSTSHTQSFYLVTPGEDAIALMADWILARSAVGGVLLVAPEAREVLLLAQELTSRAVEFSILDASLTRSERYSNYLKVASGESKIVIGSRSAIFAPVHALKTIIVYREGAQSHYEVRTPGWNTRDVALLRSQIGQADLTFVGYAPSSETSYLLEKKEIVLKGRSVKVDVQSYPALNGELLPDRIFGPIRKALERGSVLFLVSRKGYSSALMCKSCKNIAICDCGGRISFQGSAKGYSCSLCEKKGTHWSCRWCKKDQPILLGRGSQRFAHEIGRAFPGFPVITSDASSPIESVTEERSIVLATSGMAPRVSSGYQAVVILDADSLFSQIDLRAQERARESIMHFSSLVSSDGKVLVVIDSSHPIVASIARWNLNAINNRELLEREQTQLPPVVSALTIEMVHGDCQTFITGIKKAVDDGRIPHATRILGPKKITDESSRVILTVPHEDAQSLVDFLVTYRKKRSLAKKPNLSMRVDPYALS